MKSGVSYVQLAAMICECVSYLSAERAMSKYMMGGVSFFEVYLGAPPGLVVPLLDAVG